MVSVSSSAVVQNLIEDIEKLQTGYLVIAGSQEKRHVELVKGRFWNFIAWIGSSLGLERYSSKSIGAVFAKNLQLTDENVRQKTGALFLAFAQGNRIKNGTLKDKDILDQIRSCYASVTEAKPQSVAAPVRIVAVEPQINRSVQMAATQQLSSLRENSPVIQDPVEPLDPKSKEFLLNRMRAIEGRFGGWAGGLVRRISIGFIGSPYSSSNKGTLHRDLYVRLLDSLTAATARDKTTERELFLAEALIDNYAGKKGACQQITALLVLKEFMEKALHHLTALRQGIGIDLQTGAVRIQAEKNIQELLKFCNEASIHSLDKLTTAKLVEMQERFFASKNVFIATGWQDSFDRMGKELQSCLDKLPKD